MWKYYLSVSTATWGDKIELPAFDFTGGRHLNTGASGRTVRGDGISPRHPSLGATGRWRHWRTSLPTSIQPAHPYLNSTGKSYRSTAA
jgi:hypothetical protein